MWFYNHDTKQSHMSAVFTVGGYNKCLSETLSLELCLFDCVSVWLSECSLQPKTTLMNSTSMNTCVCSMKATFFFPPPLCDLYIHTYICMCASDYVWLYGPAYECSCVYMVCMYCVVSHVVYAFGFAVNKGKCSARISSRRRLLSLVVVVAPYYMLHELSMTMVSLNHT